MKTEKDCILCGDAGGYPYCYSCEDTALELDLDIDELTEEL